MRIRHLLALTALVAVVLAPEVPYQVVAVVLAAWLALLSWGFWLIREYERPGRVAPIPMRVQALLLLITLLAYVLFALLVATIWIAWQLTGTGAP